MSSRRALPALLCALLPLGCFAERGRPTPLEPDAALQAAVLGPAQNSTVLAGRTLNLDILAQDLEGESLYGIGALVLRVQGGEVMDSVAERFTVPRSNARRSFSVTVPASYPTNTQLDIRGIAYGPSGQARLSPVVSIVVIQAPSGNPGLPVR